MVAGLVAATVAGVEQSRRLGARFTLKNQAWVWWGARVSLEFGLGLLAVGLLRSTDAAVSDEVWAWIAAGAGAPAVARLRVFDLGKGEASRPIGIATAYEPVREFIEEQIDQ